MAVLPIVEVPNPLLRVTSAPVAAVDDGLRALARDMFETMYAAPGVGLAAVQVGRPVRMFVADAAPASPDGEPVRDPRVFINPEIVEASAELSTYNEGCLSIPEQYADIERPARVRARWTDLDGGAHLEWLDGFLATVVQHELDHLNGVLFVDHLSRLKREMLLKKLAKARKAA